MELSRVSEESLVDTVTMVSHNSYLFKGTVEENLRRANRMLLMRSWRKY